MPHPVIMLIDDDQAVLNAVERDVRAKFGHEYRIVKAASGATALELLARLQQRDEIVALFLVDQRMPHMTGLQFLEQARELYPEAKRVLLTAYADTEAAIASINKLQLDYYLLKPWDPPEDHLYPVLTDLLDDWRSNVKLPYEGIRVAGTLWSPRSHDVKDFLARHQIAYQWLDVDTDAKTRARVEADASGALKLPVVFFPDGTTLAEPDLKTLADKVGIQTTASLPFYDVVIIGAGPAGLAAAVYGASSGLNCLVIEKQVPGGQAGNSPRIENYLGFPAGLSGMDLARRAVTQARRFGAEIISTQCVTRIRTQDMYRVITLDLPGHGAASKPPPEWFTLENYTALLDHFCRHFGLKEIVLVGHSMGGLLSLNLALTRPDGTTATVFAPAYPPQVADVSFGYGAEALTWKLLTTGTVGAVQVPLDGSLGATWTSNGFTCGQYTGGPCTTSSSAMPCWSTASARRRGTAIFRFRRERFPGWGKSKAREGRRSMPTAWR